MLVFRNALRTARTARLSTVAPGRFASTLVFLEQKGGKLNDQSLTAVTAAKQIGGDVSNARSFPELASSSRSTGH